MLQKLFNIIYTLKHEFSETACYNLSNKKNNNLWEGVSYMTAEFKKCWMLKIYTGEDVIVGNDPLYRTILEEARRLKIAGATVIKGIEGYATEVRGIDRRPVSLFTGVSNLPVLVTIVDQKEILEKLIPFLEKKATHALVLFEESTALVTDYMRQVIAKRQADGLEK